MRSHLILSRERPTRNTLTPPLVLKQGSQLRPVVGRHALVRGELLQ